MTSTHELSKAISNPTIWISVATLLLAFFVAVRYTRRSSLSSSRSTEIGTTQELRKLPSIKVDVVDARGLIGPVERQWSYQLVIRNRSETANSIVSIRLVIVYASHGKSIRLILPPHRDPKAEGNLLMPLNIPGRHAQEGLVRFKLADAALGRRAVESLSLRVEDVGGVINEVRANTLNEQLVTDGIDD